MFPIQRINPQIFTLFLQVRKAPKRDTPSFRRARRAGVIFRWTAAGGFRRSPPCVFVNIVIFFPNTENRFNVTYGLVTSLAGAASPRARSPFFAHRRPCRLDPYAFRSPAAPVGRSGASHAFHDETLSLLTFRSLPLCFARRGRAARAVVRREMRSFQSKLPARRMRRFHGKRQNLLCVYVLGAGSSPGPSRCSAS